MLEHSGTPCFPTVTLWRALWGHVQFDPATGWIEGKKPMWRITEDGRRALGLGPFRERRVRAPAERLRTGAKPHPKQVPFAFVGKG